MAYDFISRCIELDKNNDVKYYDVLKALIKTNAQLLSSYKKRELSKIEFDTFILEIYIKKSRVVEFEKISNTKLLPKVLVRDVV